MVQFMWQADLYGVAKFHRLSGRTITLTPGGVRHLISPRWLEEMLCSSL